MIIRGTTRIVWLIPRLGIAIKFPIIHIKKFFESLFHYLTVCDQLDWFIKTSTEVQHSARFYLFKGLTDNWREGAFFLKKRKEIFLLPTFFSFFGLFNIVPLVNGLECGSDLEKSVWRALLSATKNEVMKDLHHFGEGHNFCFYKGHLRMSDYGSIRCQKIISDHFTALNELSKNFRAE